MYTATTFKYAFNYKPSNIYWYVGDLAWFITVQIQVTGCMPNSKLSGPCFFNVRYTADCGWIIGHNYVTYDPLLNGATVLVFEGVMSIRVIITLVLLGSKSCQPSLNVI